MLEGANLSTRNATQQDKAQVFEICERVYGDRDYLPEIWDNWISKNRESSEFRIGTIDDRIVGFYHLMFRGSQSWMEGLRVDVGYRRLGIGRKLAGDALDRAKKRGSRVIRLVTSQKNVESRGLFREQGFEEIQYPHYLRHDGMLSAGSANGHVRSPERGEVSDFLENSGLLGARESLSPLWWRWWEFDTIMLDELLEYGSAIGLGEKGRLDALLLFSMTSRFGYKNSVQVTFLGGTVESMGLLIKEIPRYLNQVSNDNKITGYFSIPMRGVLAEAALKQSNFTLATELVIVQKILN